MTWTDFYLICFLVGAITTVVSLLIGGMHIHVLGAHHHLHFGGKEGLHSGHAHSPSPLNLITIMTFLAWFGAVGYLLELHSGLYFTFVLGLSLLAGLVGGWVIFWFMAKFMLAHDVPMDPADYKMVGALGTLTVPIREQGTGELVYSQGGTRKTAAARSDTGAPLERGEEVVVTRFERGVAYVRRYEDLANESGTIPAASVQPGDLNE